VDEVFVMTGTLHEREMPKLPHANEPHLIPSGYWKVVAVRRGSRAHVAAFIMDQDTPRNANYCTEEHHVTVEDVEARTELDLFPRFTETTVRERRLAAEVGCR
jgi:endonuclease G